MLQKILISRYKPSPVDSFSYSSKIVKVKAAVLHPDNDFNVERTLTKDDVQKLIKVNT